MKTIGKWLYRLLYAIDNKLGYVKEYSYETAPYCGHYHNGHSGMLTHSHYHEGMGSAVHRNPIFNCGVKDNGTGWWNWAVHPESKGAWVKWTTYRGKGIAIQWHLVGFVGFNKAFTNRWFVYTGAVCHILGIRFAQSVITSN